MAGSYSLKNCVNFLSFLFAWKVEGIRVGEKVNEIQFHQEGCVIFEKWTSRGSQGREERKKKDEERGRRHSNTSYSSSVWLKVEESGQCIVPEIQALTHRRLLSVCVFPGHGSSDS